MSAVGKISPWTAKPLSDAAKNAKFPPFSYHCADLDTHDVRSPPEAGA